MGLISKVMAALRSDTIPVSVGRNDPCWCGSGRKYKKCHLDADRLKQQAKARTCTTS
jgi:hypothetical protein